MATTTTTTTVVVVFHAITLSIYSFSLYYDTYHLSSHGGRKTYAGRFKYLTFWNELIQIAFFAYSLINDFFGSNELVEKKKGAKAAEYSRLQRFRDVVFASVVFPVGVFVVITFWGIYAIDRELIFPKALDAIVPGWLNHVWHTSIVFFLGIEKYVIYHQYPSRRNGLKYSAAFYCCYMLWVFWIAFYADIWVYPVLAVMNWPVRILFCFTCAAFVALLYTLGEMITDAIWGSTVSVAQRNVD